MDTVIINGKEYLLVPKEEVPQEPAGSSLMDFVIVNNIDDGLATNKEKEEAIRVTEQDQIVDAIPTVQQAQPQAYQYYEKFVNQELSAGDVQAPNPYKFGLVKGYKDVGMIEADKALPESSRLFYGEGLSVEGSGTY